MSEHGEYTSYLASILNCIKALFTSKKFCKIEIVKLSFVFDKYCSIMD